MSKPPFDLKAFYDFCRSKPADARYDWMHQDCCALAQFGYRGACYASIKALGVPPAAYDAVILSSDATWGALADRLEAALAAQVSA